MARGEFISKQMAISKASARMVGIVAAASFVTVFCLIAAHAVWSQNGYLSRVIKAKTTANDQLKTNIKAYQSLASQYQKFVSEPTNVIGGSSTGSSNTNTDNGNNAKIILDALPDAYDFPALTTSIEAILSSESLHVSSITGTDDQVNQQGNTGSINPQAVTMPFSFTVDNATYPSIALLILSLQQSIRPIQVDSIDLSGASSDMKLTVTAHTYYQPAKKVSITQQAIK